MRGTLLQQVYGHDIVIDWYHVHTQCPNIGNSDEAFMNVQGIYPKSGVFSSFTGRDNIIFLAPVPQIWRGGVTYSIDFK